MIEEEREEEEGRVSTWVLRGEEENEESKGL